MFKTYRSLLMSAAVLALTGCAFSSEKIDVNYTPAANPTLIQGASDIRVDVRINDVRARTDRVGSRTNGYGAELGAIDLNQNVSVLIENAIETELRNRGYKLENGKVVVQVEIHDFYNRFQTGFWSGTATASVRLNVKIKDAAGTFIFSEMIAGQGTKESVQMMTGKNAKPPLEEALKNAMNSLFARDDFYAAIAKASASY